METYALHFNDLLNGRSFLLCKERRDQVTTPSHIIVGGITYKVKQMPYIEIDGDRNLLGKCDYNNQTIEIVESLNSDRKTQVLIHELVHAMLFEAGYTEHVEEQVERLGIVLHQVLNDNKFN